MLAKKKGMPEEGEIVICTVTSVQHNSVFARIDEYENKSGMIHISEISPGRIRNIRDYVKEGKTIVCKVLRIHHERGHIDLSLRRVSESQRRNKADELKQEQKAEKIIEMVAKETKKPVKELYPEIASAILKTYPTIYLCFEAVVLTDLKLESVGIKKDIAKKLEELIRQRIKPPRVQIRGLLSVVCYAADGVEVVKDALAGIEKMKDVDLRYMGGGKYKLTVEAEEYKEAEGIMSKAVDSVTKFLIDKDSEVEFTREEK
jgi:translation initiation factor 2 subunit 1